MSELSYDVSSFENIQKESAQLVEYLAANGVEPHPASRLASLLASSHDLCRRWFSKDFPADYDAHESVEALANIHCLARVVLGARGTGFEHSVKQRLSLLAKGDPGLVSPGPRSEARDLLFELVCGYVCSRFAENVHFAEPDVRCTCRGSTWAIACKVAYGSPAASVSAIRNGWRQSLGTDADRALVAVSMTNLFAHDRMYERDESSGNVASLSDLKALVRLLEAQLRSTTAPIEKRLLGSLRRHQIGDAYRVRGVLYPVHTLPYFQATRCIMGTTVFQKMGAVVTSNDAAFIRAFTEGWQRL